jgi:hypothetical protein
MSNQKIVKNGMEAVTTTRTTRTTNSEMSFERVTQNLGVGLATVLMGVVA